MRKMGYPMSTPMSIGDEWEGIVISRLSIWDYTDSSHNSPGKPTDVFVVGHKAGHKNFCRLRISLPYCFITSMFFAAMPD